MRDKLLLCNHIVEQYAIRDQPLLCNHRVEQYTMRDQPLLSSHSVEQYTMAWGTNHYSVLKHSVGKYTMRDQPLLCNHIVEEYTMRDQPLLSIHSVEQYTMPWGTSHYSVTTLWKSTPYQVQHNVTTQFTQARGTRNRPTKCHVCFRTLCI